MPILFYFFLELTDVSWLNSRGSCKFSIFVSPIKNLQNEDLPISGYMLSLLYYL